MSVNNIQNLAAAGVFFTGLLLLIALFTKITNGLFIARFPWDFVKDSKDPRFENERIAGIRFSQFVFKYLPPFFIGFVLIALFTKFIG